MNNLVEDTNRDDFDYIREQKNITEKDIEQSIQRTRELSGNINVKNNRFYEYKKRDEYFTVWDDKKLLPKNYNKPIQTPQPVILPTTSSAYGAYYNQNKIYY